jgi:hypothetical protein
MFLECSLNISSFPNSIEPQRPEDPLCPNPGLVRLIRHVRVDVLAERDDPLRSDEASTPGTNQVGDVIQ